jgi:hypothetical protein
VRDIIVTALKVFVAVTVSCCMTNDEAAAVEME